MFPELRRENALTDLPPDLSRKRPQIFSAGPDEDRRLDCKQEIIHMLIVISL